MCFNSATPPPTPDPAPPPAPPALPASQSASPTGSDQIGFARKEENRKRFGKTSGPQGRRSDVATTTGDTGSGIRM